MKKIIYFLLTFVLGINSSIICQWVQTQPLLYGHGNDICLQEDTIYVAGNLGLFKSTDNGTTWVDVAPFTNKKQFMAIDCFGKRIVTRSEEEGFFYSDNGGSTWNLFNLPEGEKICFIAKHNYCFASIVTDSYVPKLAISTDYGITWYVNPTPIQGEKITSMNFIGDTLIVGSENGKFCFSEDFGITWINRSSGIDGSKIRSMCNNGKDLFILNNKIYHTTNLGKTWILKSYSFVTNYTTVIDVAKNRLFLGVNNNKGIYISDNYADSWRSLNEGLPYKSNLTFKHNDKAVFLVVVGKNDGVFYYTFENMHLTNIVEEQNTMLSDYSLFQNYPNPFNPTTTISFNLPNAEFTSLKVYDILGKQVAVLCEEDLAAGNHSIIWDASNNSSGVYFYKLISGNYSETKKMILSK